MISYYICPTPFGYTAVLFHSDPFLLKRVFLPRPQKEVLEPRIQQAHPAKAGHTPEVLDLCKQIEAYFAGTPIGVPWRFLDLRGFTPLQRSILKTVGRVPYGEVRSYGQIAAQVGRPRAYRFVGTTVARNPFPVLIPCHRIVRADGAAGRFSGGTALKKRMLDLEQSQV